MHLLSELTGREALSFEKVAHVVVRESIQMVGWVCAVIIHLTAYQKLLEHVTGFAVAQQRVRVGGR